MTQRDEVLEYSSASPVLGQDKSMVDKLTVVRPKVDTHVDGHAPSCCLHPLTQLLFRACIQIS